MWLNVEPVSLVALKVKQYHDVGTKKLKFFVTSEVSFSLLSVIFAGDSCCLNL